MDISNQPMGEILTLICAVVTANNPADGPITEAQREAADMLVEANPEKLATAVTVLAGMWTAAVCNEAIRRGEDPQKHLHGVVREIGQLGAQLTAAGDT